MMEYVTKAKFSVNEISLGKIPELLFSSICMEWHDFLMSKIHMLTMGLLANLSQIKEYYLNH